MPFNLDQDWAESTHARAGVFRLFRSIVRAVGMRRIAAPIRWLTISSDRLLYRQTGGRWSTSAMARIPSLTLLLRRPGRDLMAVPLQYTCVDGQIYVAGTNWGRPNHPLWTVWLCRDGECAVNLRGYERRCTARLVEGADRRAIWPAITRKTPYLEQCQRRCGREIRIFRLEPAC